MNTIKLNIDVMECASQHVPSEVTVPSVADMTTCLRLEFEELCEKAEAMGLKGTFQQIMYDNLQENGTIFGFDVEFEPEKDTKIVNLNGVFDACLDQRVVNDSTIARFGFHNLILGQSIFVTGYMRVHFNNLTKFPTSEKEAKIQQQLLSYPPHMLDVQIVPSQKFHDRWALIDNNGKYRKPVSFKPVDLTDLVPVTAIEAQ